MAGGWEGVQSQMPSNLQGQDPNAPPQNPYQGRGGFGGMIGNLLWQQGQETGGGPFGHLWSQAGGGGYLGPNTGDYSRGYMGGYERVYDNPAHYLQMGNLYGQLGSYNTLARDMASGNVGNYAFGYGGQPFTYQGGMHPTGRAGAWGRPMSALAQYGADYGFGGMAGRGGGGRNVGTWPGTGFGGGAGFPALGGVATGGRSPWGFASNQPGMYGMGPSGGEYYGGGFRPPFEPNTAWNPFSRGPGRVASTPRGLVSDVTGRPAWRIPGAPEPQAMTTGANQAGLAAAAMAGRQGGNPGWQQGLAAGAAPIYASDAWRREETGVRLPFQLPASAQNLGFARSAFLY